MRAWFTSLLAGLLFGLGLGLSQMINPARVKGFLDIFGAWDPSLIFVLGGAVGVTVVSFRLVLRRAAPVCDTQFYIPARTQVDRRLIAGAALFGVGWGLTGYCPGPGLAGLALGSVNALIFSRRLCRRFALGGSTGKRSPPEKHARRWLTHVLHIAVGKPPLNQRRPAASDKNFPSQFSLCSLCFLWLCFSRLRASGVVRG